jgi:hypothetical protein
MYMSNGYSHSMLSDIWFNDEIEIRLPSRVVQQLVLKVNLIMYS